MKFKSIFLTYLHLVLESIHKTKIIFLQFIFCFDRQKIKLVWFL